jgi:CoA:oxalate CoA-transferase
MNKPLKNIRILDLSNVLAGPFCTYQLALMGAEVIKIESPERGDLARSLGADADAASKLMGVSFLAVNAGKQSITLNLKHIKGKDILKRMVVDADVLVENFRPGVMARLGLDYPVLKDVNPGLVYCAISGFGQTGPWSDRPAYDQIIQGLSGLMSVTGDAQTSPLRAGFPICDTVGGMSAAFAIAAALVSKVNTGQGCMIDVSMLEATLASMGWVVSNYLATGKIPQPMGNENFTAAPSGAFRTRDGLLNIAANEQKQFESLCDLIDRPLLKSDARFAQREMRKANRYALKIEIEAALVSQSSADWESLLNEVGVPSGQILSVPEILMEEQLSDRDFVVDMEGVPGLGRSAHVTRGGFVIDGIASRPDSPPPVLGAHTATWLHNLGYGDAEIVGLRIENVI